MPAGVYNLPELIRGDSYDLTCIFWADDARTTRRDLSASTFASQLRVFVDDVDWIDFDVDDTNAATGVIVLSLTPDDTKDLWASSYAWDLQETDGSGNIATQVRGVAPLTKDVTR